MFCSKIYHHSDEIFLSQSLNLVYLYGSSLKQTILSEVVDLVNRDHSGQLITQPLGVQEVSVLQGQVLIMKQYPWLLVKIKICLLNQQHIFISNMLNVLGRIIFEFFLTFKIFTRKLISVLIN